MRRATQTLGCCRPDDSLLLSPELGAGGRRATQLLHLAELGRPRQPHNTDPGRKRQCPFEIVERSTSCQIVLIPATLVPAPVATVVYSKCSFSSLLF